MKSPAKKNIGPSMLPALSLNGLVGIIPGMDNPNKNFNCGLSIHQKFSPIIYFRMKNKEFFPLEKIPSNVSILAFEGLSNLWRWY
jgi:hypothetical protein